MILSPLLMTWVFARFAAEDAAIFLPGAPFLVSAVLILICIAVFSPSLRRVSA